MIQIRHSLLPLVRHHKKIQLDFKAIERLFFTFKIIMSLPLKSKILFAAFSGLTFAMLNGLVNFFLLDKPFHWGIFLFNFLFFGLSFGFGYLYFMKMLSKRTLKKIIPELLEGEVIQHEGPANLFRGIEAVGGKLLITNKRLVFKSHKVNIQRGQVNLALGQVTGVISRKTSKIFDNGLRVLDQSGEKFDFVVFERDQWISRIEKAIQTT